jgi:hypothetical protein
LLNALDLKTFFLSQKKFSNFQKNALWSSMGRCPIPHPLFEKSGAKTFMSASPGIEFGYGELVPRKALAFRIEKFLHSNAPTKWSVNRRFTFDEVKSAFSFQKACGGLEAEPPRF